MNNNRAQVLILFVIFLPIFILIFAYVFDISNTTYEQNKLKSIGNTALEYAKEKQLTEEEIIKYIKDNDSDINVNVIMGDKIKIQLVKYVDSVFGKITGNNEFTVKVIIEG